MTRRAGGRFHAALRLLAAAGFAMAAAPAVAGEAGEASVALAEFIAGRPLDEATRKKLSDLADGEVGKSSDGAAQAKRLEKLVAGLKALPDEPARAEARRKIVTELYWRTREKPDPVSELALDGAAVVAADPETRAVVRRADLDGFCRSAALAADLLRKNFDPAACRTEAETAATTELKSMPRGDREVVATGERRAALLAAFWKDLPAARRDKVIAVVRNEDAALEPGRIGRSLETAAISARLKQRIEKFGEAANRGLVDGAVATAIQSAARGM